MPRLACNSKDWMNIQKKMGLNFTKVFILDTKFVSYLRAERFFKTFPVIG